MNDIAETLGIKVKIFSPPTDEEIMDSYMGDMWVDQSKGIINENTFAKAFRDVNHLRYNNGLFYTRSGKITEEVISRDIWKSIEQVGINRDVERTVKKLVGTTKLASTVDSLQVNTNIIPFANGDFYVHEWEFHGDEYSPVPYRLNASLKLYFEDITNFSNWLHNLFYEEDIETVQEYLGYCLVSSTRGQKALFLVGEGGTGKSGIGVILQEILGEAILNTANTQEFMQDKFKLPELEHKLVLYDDDLDSAALTETGLYKKLITNTLAITADRKYGQPFKFTPSIKLVACCNKMLTATYDNTSGFYRRLLPIVVKPMRKDFVPDLQFYEKLRKERDGIVQWALIGLNRLISHNWILHESQRTKDYMEQKQTIDNPLPIFMTSVFEYDPAYTGVPITEIMKVYEYWCRKNSVTPMKSRAVQIWLSDNAEKYGIKTTTNLQAENKRVRGYKGLRITAEWDIKNRIILS